MFKKILTTILLGTPLLLNANITKTGLKAIVDGATKAGTDGVFQLGTNAITYTAAGELHAIPPQMDVTLPSVDLPIIDASDITTMGSMDPQTLPVEEIGLPMDTGLKNSDLPDLLPGQTLPTLSDVVGSDITGQVVSDVTEQTFFSSHHPFFEENPNFKEADTFWKKLKKKNPDEFFMEKLPFADFISTPHKMRPEQIAQARNYYISVLSTPYDLKNHPAYIRAITMLSVLGKKGDGSGAAIANFLFSYDNSEGVRVGALNVAKDAINASAEFRSRLGKSPSPIEDIDGNIRYLEAQTAALSRMNRMFIGNFAYLTEMTALRSLVLLEEWDLIQASMDGLNELLKKKPKSTYLVKQLMPYQQLEYVSNNFGEPFPLAFPQWPEDVALPDMSAQLFEMDALREDMKLSPLEDALIGEVQTPTGWWACFQTKKWGLDTSKDLFKWSDETPGRLHYFTVDFYCDKGYKKNAPETYDRPKLTSSTEPRNRLTGKTNEPALLPSSSEIAPKIGGKPAPGTQVSRDNIQRMIASAENNRYAAADNVFKDLTSKNENEFFFFKLTNQMELLSHPENIRPADRQKAVDFYYNFLRISTPEEPQMVSYLRLTAMTMLGFLGEKGDHKSADAIIHAVKRHFKNPSWLVDYTAFMAIANLGEEELALPYLFEFRQKREEMFTGTAEKASTPGIAWLYTRIFFSYDLGIKKLSMDTPYYSPNSRSMSQAFEELQKLRKLAVNDKVMQKLLELDSRFLKGQDPDGKNIFPAFPTETGPQQ